MKTTSTTLVSLLLIFGNSYGQEKTQTPVMNRDLNKNLKTSNTGITEDQEPIQKNVSFSQPELTVEPSQTQLLVDTVQTTFVPIQAEGYTDENYYINLEKSRALEQQLNQPATHLEVIPETTEQTIQRYVIARDKYPIDSYEYNLIQSKIDQVRNND
jgi:hypothetical protein